MAERYMASRVSASFWLKWRAAEPCWTCCLCGDFVPKSMGRPLRVPAALEQLERLLVLRALVLLPSLARSPEDAAAAAARGCS